MSKQPFFTRSFKTHVTLWITYFIIAWSSTQENELITHFITQLVQGFIKMWDQMKNYIIEVKQPNSYLLPKINHIVVVGMGWRKALNLDVKIHSHLRFMHATFAGSKLPSLNSPLLPWSIISIIAHMGPLKKGLVCNSGFDFLSLFPK